MPIREGISVTIDPGTGEITTPESSPDEIPADDPVSLPQKEDDSHV